MAIENDITEEHMKAIEILRQRFKDSIDPEMYEDVYFFRRFLKAQELNIDKAEAMIKKDLEWRKKNDIKNLMLNFKKPEVIEKYCHRTLLGYDKEGCIVIYCPAGIVDINGVMSSCTFEDMIDNAIHDIETAATVLKTQSQVLQRNVEKVVGIVDLANLSFAKVSDKRAIFFFINLLRICKNHYPGRLKALYIFNVSIYFNFVYSLLKSVLPASVMKKFHIYSDESYKEDLLKVMDADELPAFLGGNKTDPDGNPLCLTFGINHSGDKVPQSFYIQSNKQKLSKRQGVKKVTLYRSEFHEIKLEVTVPESYLEWEFETKCRDIGFGLFYEDLSDGEEKISELVPIQRINTEYFPEAGSIKCEKLGTYVIVFDNTYSWVRGKEIYYRAKVVSPKEHEAEMKR